MNTEAVPDPRAVVLAALPVALMGFSDGGRLFLVNAEMRALLRVDMAALSIGAAERDVFRMMAFRGALGSGDPEQRLREILALDPNHVQRRLLRDIEGRGLELRLAPMPGGGRVLTLQDVSEYTQAREAAEQELRAITDVMSRLNNGVAQYDQKRQLARSNPAYAQLLGLDPRALTPGLGIAEIITRQRDAGQFDAALAAAVIDDLTTRPLTEGWRVERTRPDGRTVRFENQPMPGGGWLAEITDITDAHLAEQDVRRRVALQDALMDALPVGVAVYGPDRTLTMMNPAYNRIMSHSTVSIGENLRDILMRRAIDGEFGPCDPATEVAQRLSTVNTAHGFERRSVSGTATSHRSVPLPDGGHAMVVADVTALHAAQAEARERAEILSHMLESTRHGMALFDAEGTVIAANRLAEHFAGLPPDTFVAGANIRELRALQIARGVHGDKTSTDRFLADRTTEPLRGPDRYRRILAGGAVIEVITDKLPDGGYVRSFTDISAQVQAEAEANIRAATLQDVLDNMRHGIILYDGDGRVRTGNALGAKLAGIPPELMKPGAHFDDLRDLQAERGEYGEAEAAMRWRAGRASEPWRGESTYTRKRPDGTIIEVRTDLIPGGGSVRSFTDITALTDAQAAAASRAAMVQAMLDNMHHGIALFDDGHRVLTANTLCAELMGLQGFVRPGVTYAELLAEQRGRGEFGPEPGASEREKMLLGRDKRESRSSTRKRPSGEEIEIAANPAPGGGFVLTLTDITARVKAEREVERRAVVLGATLNAARQGIMLFDAEGRVVAANDIAGRLTDRSDAQALIGRSHLDLTLGQHRFEGASPAELAAVERRILEVDRGKPYRHQRHRRDGIILDISSDPMPDNGYVVCVSDVTELVTAREQAQARAAALAATLDASRHGITLFGPDSRVIATNRISMTFAGYPTPEAMVGQSYEAVLRQQLSVESLKAGDAGDSFVNEMLALDRAKPIRYQRRRATGEVFDIASDPTPDGGFVVSVSDVTQLVDTREEAQRRAGILQVMLENSRQGIMLYDSQQRLVAANALAGEIMGVPDLLGKPGTTQREVLAAQRARGLFPGADGGAGLEAYFLGLDRSKPHRMQRDLPDGRRFDVASDPTPDGGYVVSEADITPLVRAEEAAKNRAGVLRTMLENNTSGVLLYDPEQRLLAFNSLAIILTGTPDLEDCVGLTLAEMLERRLRDGQLGPGEAGESERAWLLGLDRTQAQRSQRLTADGRVLNFASDPTPDGGFVVSLTDVTPLARAEAEAKRRAEILGVMLGNIRHGIVLFDAGGRLVASNAKLREMLRLGDDALVPGTTLHNMVDALREHGEYGEGEEGLRVAEAIKARPRVAPIRSLRPRPDGGVVDVVSDPTPDGGWVVTYTDVTEDRRIRTELETAREAAEAANRAKSRFLATISHELRTPLNAVIGFSEVLRGEVTAEQTEEFASAIHEAGRHLLSLIDDILDVTRAETSALPVVLEEVALAPLLEGAARMIGPAVTQGQLSLTLEVPPGLPLLRADQRRLRQVLLNLLSNATKFTAPGGQLILRARMDETQLVIEVQDTGIGIEAKDLERVFEPFTQLDSALSRRFPGSGLGLNLGRALTEAQGGTLVLDSTPGEGTIARITFPPSRLIS